MLVAHFDDSGTSGKEGGFVLAGIIGEVRSLQQFSNDWLRTLKGNASDGDPQIRYFRMVEAQRRRDQFQGMSAEQRNRKVNALAKLIRDYDFDVLAVLAMWEDLNEFNKWFKSPVHPYRLFFSKAVWLTLELVRVRFPNEQVEIIFDDQGLLGSDAASINDRQILALSHRYRRLLCGRPVHRSDKTVLPLQAADLLAWYLRKGLTRDGPTFASVPEPLQGMRLTCEFLSLQELKRMQRGVLELVTMIPDISDVNTETELKQRRNHFLGYDPDLLP